MNILALLLIIDASILASMDGPDLPDDFRKSETTATVEAELTPAAQTPVVVVRSPTPLIHWEVAAGSTGLVKSSTKISERWLVSEDWCANCPAAKRRFLASGGQPQNIITIAEAKRLHGKSIDGVPHEYTVQTEREVIQPPSYRRQNEMAVELNNKKRPPKSEILNHLRTGGPHKEKHWQSWFLESWEAEQLYALHDDDHFDRVPTFDEQTVSAIVANAQGSPELVAGILAAHLLRRENISEEQAVQAVTGLFEITVDTPESARKWAADLLSKQSVEFPKQGVSASWKGSDRTISVRPGRVQITPGAIVSVKKFGVSLSTTLRGVSFADDLSWLTLELDGAPDLTVRFQ
jgi:hypothetical protein